MTAPALSGGVTSTQYDKAGPADARPALAIRTMRARREFLAANKGARFPCPSVLLIVHDRKDGDAAIGLGLTVTKKIGNAVVRNRMKRRYRALAAELLPVYGIAGADHVFIGRHSAVERDFDAMRRDLKNALKRAARP